MVRITKRCIFCGKENSIEITEEVNKKYKQYLKGIGFIQDIPLSADQREFLKTGMCFNCQEIMFDEDEEE